MGFIAAKADVGVRPGGQKYAAEGDKKVGPVKATFYFDRDSIAPDGVEIDLICIPNRGDWLYFDGEIGEKIAAWADEANDVLVVLFVQHEISPKLQHSVRVECGMSRSLGLI